MANERKRVFKFTKTPSMQAVSETDNIDKPPISTESTSAISCAALLMQYGPFTCMEYYDLQSRCRSYDGVEAVDSLRSKMNTGWTFYNAKSSGKSYEECKMTDLGREYRGILNVTVNGRQCQSWGATGPQVVNVNIKWTLNNEEGPGIFDTNYCRNPDHTPGGPWCYTVDSSIKYEFCDIPYCHCYNET